MDSLIELAFIKQEREERACPGLCPDFIKNEDPDAGAVVNKQEEEGSLDTEMLGIVVKTEMERDTPDVKTDPFEASDDMQDSRGCSATPDQSFIEVELLKEDLGQYGLPGGRAQERRNACIQRARMHLHKWTSREHVK
uniref:Uncharacterized protein LOC116939595 isoform X3 n=1 Tax=Petromyzon marinus TaxID=7757 RepID=A0AAJ7WNG9_PETMA|nr:uncharacterized protein LOC116939595 isoform X3 [Petromyzon marinus]